MKDVKMPASVFIWPRRFAIKNEPVPGTQDMGQISLLTRVIHVAPGDSQQEQALTLCHEIAHAMLATTGGRCGDNDEVMAGGLAQMLYGVIRDNPELVRYIQSMDESQP